MNTKEATLQDIYNRLPSREYEIRTALEKYLPKIPIHFEINLRSNPLQIAVLKEIGENPTTPKMLTHLARFSTEHQCEFFENLIMKQGFSVQASLYHQNSPFYQYQLEFLRADLLNIESIDKITLELCELADRFHGFYFGWKPLNPPTAYNALYSGHVEFY